MLLLGMTQWLEKTASPTWKPRDSPLMKSPSGLKNMHMFYIEENILFVRQGFPEKDWAANICLRFCMLIAESDMVNPISSPLPPPHFCYKQWGRRLEGWPFTENRLAGWRRGVILYVMDGLCRLLRRTTPLDPAWGWSIPKCTQNTAMSCVTQGRQALIDPCLLFGFKPILGDTVRDAEL